jgi:acylphosphatase
VPDTGIPQRRHVLYEGMVQGVGFRYSARRIASRFAVAGFVRNLPDGRVELVVEGVEEVLDQFLAAVGEQMGDYISRTRVTMYPATDEFRQFGIRF